MADLSLLKDIFNLAQQEAKKPYYSPSNPSYDTSYRGAKASRLPFKITTIDNTTPIYFWVNPNECSWRIPLRTTIEQVQGGAVHHEWDATGLNNTSKFDQPTINFSFQSGNIAPFGTTDVSETRDPVGNYETTQDRTSSNDILTKKNVSILPAGLGNFYDFLNLLNQPNIAKNGAVNYVKINYISLMFPQLELLGFFTSDGVQWNDSAENPLGISSWGASFVVFESSPPLHNGELLRQMFANKISI